MASPQQRYGRFATSSGNPFVERDAWKCGGVDYHFDLPTVWGSQSDLALLTSLRINALTACGLLVLFALLSRNSFLRRRIYERYHDDDAVVWPPQRWWRLLTSGFSLDTLIEDHDTLDLKMLLRYLRFMLHVFAGVSLFGLLMLPLFALRPAATRLDEVVLAAFAHDLVEPESTPTQLREQLWYNFSDPASWFNASSAASEAARANRQQWSGLESMSVVHLPPGSGAQRPPARIPETSSPAMAPLRSHAPAPPTSAQRASTCARRACTCSPRSTSTAVRE